MKGKQAILRYLETHRTFTAKDVSAECGITINCITKNAIDLERARKIVRVSKVWRTVTYRLATPEEQAGTARNCTNGIFQECRICSASLDAAIKTGNMLADQNAQLAAENVEAKKIISECREYFIAGVMNRIRPTNEGYLHMICDTFADETPATDRIVAGIKADGVAEREKTITFTAAKKRTQDGVALIAIGKPYKIHNDDVIGEFFIGERGRYGVITMDRLDYFTTSDEYAWEFSLREGADK